jgi:hypothetical protein
MDEDLRSLLRASDRVVASDHRIRATLPDAKKQSELTDRDFPSHGDAESINEPDLLPGG